MSGKRAALYTGWAAIAAGGAVVLWLRLTNFDLTEGRLLVEYWPLWILSAALLIGGYLLVSFGWNNER